MRISTVGQASHREPFRHRPLDHSRRSIRLITVDQLLSDGLISCRIRHANIKDSYQCLSYRWGSPNPSHTILLNYDDEKERKEYSVGQSLFEFLCLVRKSTHTGKAGGGSIQSAVNHLGRTFWIDALCIDQAKVAERSHQVQQMDEIFLHAYRAVIWVGNTSQPDELWMDDIRSELQHPRPQMIREKDVRHLVTESSRNFHGFLEDLCYNEYWERAWIAQEIVLAKEVYVLLVGQLVRLSWLAMHFSDLEPILRFARLRLELPSDMNRRRFPVLQFLDEFRGRSCAVPHDRVYSILGLIDEWDRIVVDYGQPPAHLAFKILKVCAKSLCLCTVLLVAQVLGASQLDATAIEHHQPYMEITVAGWRSADPYVDLTTLKVCTYLGQLIARFRVMDSNAQRKLGVTVAVASDGDHCSLRIPFATLLSTVKDIRCFRLCENAKKGEPATIVEVGLDPPQCERPINRIRDLPELEPPEIKHRTSVQAPNTQYVAENTHQERPQLISIRSVREWLRKGLRKLERLSLDDNRGW